MVDDETTDQQALYEAAGHLRGLTDIAYYTNAREQLDAIGARLRRIGDKCAAAEARIAELTAALERVTKELEWKQAEADDAHKDVNEWASRYDQLRADLERVTKERERDLSRASEITRGAVDDRAAACASLDQALTLLRESESGKMCSAALEGEAMCSELPACYLHRRAAFLAAHPSPPKEPTT